MPVHRSISDALDEARLMYWERPGEALEVATRVREQARRAGSAPLQSRATALQGAVSLHGGDLSGAFALRRRPSGWPAMTRGRGRSSRRSTRTCTSSPAPTRDSLRWAHEAIELADEVGDRGLRLHARRMGCLAFGNLGVDDLADRFREVLELAREAGSPWEEAVAHNDLAHLRMTEGAVAEAGRHIDEGLAVAQRLEHSSFLRGVLHATRSELLLEEGRAQHALAEAERAVGHVLEAASDANPYLLGMSVLVEVQALLALGRVGDAVDAGERAIERLGERVPQARSMILTVVADALREAGRAEEAYDTLARAAAFEREALAEFPRLLLGLERARLEAAASRHEADALAATNRELRAVVSQLATTGPSSPSAPTSSRDCRTSCASRPTATG